MAIVFSITPLAPATPPAALSSSSVDYYCRGAALLCHRASDHLQASLPLRSDPNFLPMWLSSSLRWQQHPEKHPSLAQASRWTETPEEVMPAVWGVGAQCRMDACRWIRSGLRASAPGTQVRSPVSGLSQQKGNQLVRVQSSLEPSPELEVALDSVCKPLPEQAVDRTRSVYTGTTPTSVNSSHWEEASFPRRTHVALSTWGWSPTRKEGVGFCPDKPTPQNRGILTQAGRGLAHTAHSRYSADFDQLITAKVSCDQPYPNSGSAQMSPSRGVLAQRPLDDSYCSWTEPWGCT